MSSSYNSSGNSRPQAGEVGHLVGSLLAHEMMGSMTPVRGRRSGNLGICIVALTVPGTLILLVASTFGDFPKSSPVIGCVVGVTYAVIFHIRNVIQVDEAGITLIVGVPSRSVPWSDIERIECHRLSARIRQKSNGKGMTFSMFDPYWPDRPVAQAIRAHLDT